jgi:ceramide glucosyltransferase
MTYLILIPVLLCTLWTLFGFAAVFRTTHRRRGLRSARLERPGVSVMKPLCGADPGLEQNLESLFVQHYTNFEIVFGVEDPQDPALAVVEALRARHPHVACRVVVQRGPTGINPKVRNLRGMLPYTRHDLLLVSDSNVRAPHHYMADMVDTLLADESTGLVTNLVAGSGEDNLAAGLENVQLNGFIAAGAALPTLLGDALLVGKSMLLSRRRFEELGGFERVANVLAEDFVMGKMFQHAGLRVVIAATVLENVTARMTLHAFHDRHLRWAMLRWRLRPIAYLLEPLTSPLALLAPAYLVFGPIAIAWAGALLVVRDVGGWLLLRGSRRAWLPLLLSPLREIAVLAAWLRAPLKRHVMWRGHRVRLGAGTLLFEGAAARCR